MNQVSIDVFSQNSHTFVTLITYITWEQLIVFVFEKKEENDHFFAIDL